MVRSSQHSDTSVCIFLKLSHLIANKVESLSQIYWKQTSDHSGTHVIVQQPVASRYRHSSTTPNVWGYICWSLLFPSFEIVTADENTAWPKTPNHESPDSMVIVVGGWCYDISQLKDDLPAGLASDKSLAEKQLLSQDSNAGPLRTKPTVY